MINRTFALLFFLKKDKKQPNGTVPLYLRVTIDGQRADISTKRYINPDVWLPKEQKMGRKSEENRSVNAYLKTFEHDIFETHRQLITENKIITAEVLKNRIQGIEEKPRMLQQILKRHNEDIKALIGKGYSHATWVKYCTTQRHLTEFLKWKYNLSDISLKQLSYEFVTDFEFYLKSEKSIDVNTNAKYIKNLKKIVRECVSKNWLDKDPFMAYKVKSKQTEREYLTELEIETLEEKEFEFERLTHIRDIFLFSCYTGLAYVDVYNLTPDHISLGMDGEKWIFTHRQKTEIASRIPLLPPALAILKKYEKDKEVMIKGKLLPVPSNQKVNAYLKEIATCCGIKKELTFHVARHTFATTVTLTNGVPIESVSKMLGHKKLQTTQHYAKILDKKVSNDMNLLRSKYQSKLSSGSKKKTGS